MGYKLSCLKFNDYLQTLKETHRIYGPVAEIGKGKFAQTDVVGYGEVKNFENMVFDTKSYYSPKDIFYPIRETLFYFLNNHIETPEIDEKPILIFLRPCDLNGINNLDTIFLKNGEITDFYYLRRRNLIKFMMIECTKGFETCFCVSMNSNRADNYDGVVRIESDAVTVKINDESLNKKVLSEGVTVEFEPEFIGENRIKVTIPDVDAVTKKTFNHDIWKEYTSRCIACGRCNTSCITCSCYTMQDVKLSDNKKIGERRRVWAGCHVDGFTDMAHGSGYRDKNGERMRFKTMHKINDYYKRFNKHMCVGCGRCDDVCPEYISFSKCINKLNKIVEEDKNND